MTSVVILFAIVVANINPIRVNSIAISADIKEYTLNLLPKVTPARIVEVATAMNDSVLSEVE